MIAPELLAFPEFAQVGGKKRGPKGTKRKSKKGRGKGTKRKGRKGSLRRKKH
tara:strand:- start:306 stop:461 length:156 start_codon:yes stop_codon:yes gene_type:complete